MLVKGATGTSCPKENNKICSTTTENQYRMWNTDSMPSVRNSYKIVVT